MENRRRDDGATKTRISKGNAQTSAQFPKIALIYHEKVRFPTAGVN